MRKSLFFTPYPKKKKERIHDWSLPRHVLKLLVNLQFVFCGYIPWLCLGVLLAGSLGNRINTVCFGLLVFGLLVFGPNSFGQDVALSPVHVSRRWMTYSSAFVNIRCWDLDKYFDIALDRLLGTVDGQLVDTVLVDLDVVERKDGWIMLAIEWVDLLQSFLVDVAFLWLHGPHETRREGSKRRTMRTRMHMRVRVFQAHKEHICASLEGASSPFLLADGKQLSRTIVVCDQCLGRLEWSGVQWTGVEWSALDWSGVDWTGLDWTVGGWIVQRMRDSETAQEWQIVEVSRIIGKLKMSGWNGGGGEKGRGEMEDNTWKQRCSCLCPLPCLCWCLYACTYACASTNAMLSTFNCRIMLFLFSSIHPSSLSLSPFLDVNCKRTMQHRHTGTSKERERERE